MIPEEKATKPNENLSIPPTENSTISKESEIKNNTEPQKDEIYDLIGGLDAMAETNIEESQTKTINDTSQTSKISRGITYVSLIYGSLLIMLTTIILLYADQSIVPKNIFRIATIIYMSLILRVSIILYMRYLEKQLSENERIYRRLTILSGVYSWYF